LKYPPIDVRLKKENERFLVFDTIRKKWLVLTPEEWVRQHIIHWLIHEKKIASGLISVEKELLLNGTKKRYDIVIYSSQLTPKVVIECKAPEIALNESVLEQALRYNLELKAPYFFISNGLEDALFKAGENSIKRLEDWEDMLND
jgi:type I site-specific restriction endonuclease